RSQGLALSLAVSGFVKSSRKPKLFVTGLTLSTPIPPLTLFDRQLRVLCLCNSGGKDVQAANVLRLSFQPAEIPVHLPRVFTRKLGYAANSQELQISQHGRTYRYQIL